MVYFQTKNPNLGKFWSVCIAIQDVGNFHGHSVYYTSISYIFCAFGIY
jgi:hypothetical protein